MKNNIKLFVVMALLLTNACSNQKASPITDEEIWKLGWRMIENSMDEKFKLAELQFDSLLSISQKLDFKFLFTGLEIKSELDKTEALTEILSKQDEDILKRLCKYEFLKKITSCNGLTEGETVKNKSLQMELIAMYVDDQAVRFNIMHDIISKYGLDLDKVVKDDIAAVDENNRNRLKEIFKEFGFPNKEMIGQLAMQGVFFIIQHSDGDKDWQKSQLSNIERAVKNGDIDGQSYAYLYDRIKVGAKEKQLYGTQFAKVDTLNKIAELKDTEDLINLNKRRREIGMMPIEMYKRFMLRSF